MTKKTNTGRHLYNRGWLGLIPLIGGIAGLYLILLGILKYRDKKLATIGAVALLFTLVAYSSMFYYFKVSKSFRKDFSKFCEPKLNNLVKSIEYYKTDIGRYPDSLDQVTKDSSWIQIDDPIAQSNDDNKGQFYYKKMNNKYVLFSSGIDRIPYNQDDIYPNSKYFDSTKTGLIKP